VGPYIYPPLLSVLFAPIAWPARSVGHLVWGGLQLAFVASSLIAVASLCRVPWGRGRRDFALWVSAPLFASIWATVGEGQINLLVVTCVAAGLALIDRDRPLTGGALLAVGAHLKVLPIVLLGVLLAQGRGRAVAGMATGLVLLLGAPLVWTVPAEGLAEGLERAVDLHVEWVEALASPHLASQEAAGIGGTRAPNNALSAVVKRWFGSGSRLSARSRDRSPLVVALPPPITRWAGFGLAALLYLAALMLAYRLRPRPPPTDSWGPAASLGLAAPAGLALVAAALGNLTFWTHHLVFLMLMLGPLVTLGLTVPAARSRVGLAVSALVLCTLLPPLDRTALFDRMGIWGLPTAGVLLAWSITFATFLRAPAEGSGDPSADGAHDQPPSSSSLRADYRARSSAMSPAVLAPD
jgi:hypothetical protein